MHRSHFSLIGSLLLGACIQADEAVSPNGQRETAQISDARHGVEGNPHFYFLPPIVAHPGATGDFDPTLNPVVEICEWDTVCGPVAARFTRASGNGGEKIEVTSGEYRVNWNTKACLAGPCTLDPSKTYRVSVAVSGVLLGFADLDVVSNGSQLKNVETGEFIGLVEGRTLPVKFRIDEGAIDVVSSNGGSATITPSTGGTVATADGKVVVEIPAGALAGTAPVEITVTPAAVGDPADESMIPGSVVEFGPDGITFEKPVTIKLTYNPALIPSGVPEQHLRLQTFDEDAGVWRPVDGTTVDVVTNTVTADVRHFSEYAAGEVPPPDFDWWGTFPDRSSRQRLPSSGDDQYYVIEVEDIGAPQVFPPFPAIDGYGTGWPWIAAHAIWGSHVGQYNCTFSRSYESANPAIVSIDSV